ncbi:MAG: hypothetical protein QF662_08690, partial [Phycisphaerae bacterium]|nr:hypothetical protein [Phycisphaerae bacterium]
FEKKLLDVFQRRFDRSKGPKRQEAGKEFLDELLAVAEASEASEDFAAAARLLGRALRIAKATKSERRGEVEHKAKRAAALAPIGKRIAQEKGRLKADPKNRSARMKLIWIYLVDLDNPATAAEYVDDSVSEKMSERVRVAADGPPAPTAGDALELGRWYRGLAKKAGPASREAMLQRARGYYKQFIASLPKKPPADQPPNPDRAKGIEGLAQVQAELGNLVAAALKTGRWNDLLKLIDIKKHAKGGTWRRDAGGGIRGQAGWAQDHVMLPIAVDGSYQLRVRFTRLSGTDTIALMFPVASAPALLELSAKGGSYSQLYEVKKTRVTPAEFENDVEYTLDIKVMARGAGASVSVDLNGERFMRWRGPRGGLKRHAEWKLANPRALGLGIHGCTVIFHSAELRMASGSRAN